MNSDTVAIRIGDPSQVVEIQVDCELICSVSPYFRSAFKGKFKEATDRVISLPDVSEQTFRIFLQWANSQVHDSYSDTLIPEISSLPSTLSPVGGHQNTCTYPERKVEGRGQN